MGWPVVGGALVVLVGGFLACGHLWTSAKARLARYLDVSDTSSEVAIEADLHRKLPAGTSMRDVRDYLDRRGLRPGGGSTRYYLSDANGIEQQDIDRATAVACVFDYTPVIAFGMEHYYVWFLFDETKQLKSVKVRCMVDDL